MKKWELSKKSENIKKILRSSEKNILNNETALIK